MPCVSIIVPVYNAEGTLLRCYESLVGQTYVNLEIIFVNDGSTDGSSEVLRRLEREDRRVCVINQKNLGTLRARKNGVSRSTGDWCLFVDPDDWLDVNTCKVLVEMANDPPVDIISFGATIEGGEPEDCEEVSGIERWLNRGPMSVSGGELAEKVFVDDVAPQNIWGKFIRGDTCRVAFSEQENVDAIYAEDHYAFFCVVKKAARGMRIVGNRFYHYSFGNGIATRRTMCVTSFSRAANVIELADGLVRRYADLSAKSFRSHVLTGLFDVIVSKIAPMYQKECLGILYKRCAKEDVVEAVVSSKVARYGWSGNHIEELDLLFSEVLVSIVIPVYNVEKYLCECLESVMGQTHSNIEVIVVNDGSTDGSRKILDAYSQIRVIDQVNRGPGAARNVGLDSATGKYVYFLDSDDKIKPETIAVLTVLSEVAELDQLVFGAETFSDDETIDEVKVEKERQYQTVHPSVCGVVMSGIDFLRKALACELPVSPPLRFYRRDFLHKNGLRYPEGILHEDNAFAWISIYLSKRICAIDRPLFMRRVRDASIMQSKDNAVCRADGFLRNIELILGFRPFWLADMDVRNAILRDCVGPLLACALMQQGEDWFWVAPRAVARGDGQSSGARDIKRYSIWADSNHIIKDVCWQILPWGMVLACQKLTGKETLSHVVFTRRFRYLKYLFPYGCIRYWTWRRFGEF